MWALETGWDWEMETAMEMDLEMETDLAMAMDWGMAKETDLELLLAWGLGSVNYGSQSRNRPGPAGMQVKSTRSGIKEPSLWDT